jgi:uncharacterized protein (DUF1501 family)
MRLTRRDLLRTTGYGMTALLMPAALLRAARADTSTNVLVVAFLSGGADGLSLAIPDGDPHYARVRPHIAIDASESLAASSRYATPANRALGMDDFFRLSPEWPGLRRRFDAGELAIVHGVGSTGSYSHVTARDGMERADPEYAVAPSGWLHRALAKLAAPSAMSGVALAGSPIASIAGPDQSIYLGFPSLESFGLKEPAVGDRRGVLQSMYAPERLPRWNGGAKHALELIGGSTAELFSLLDSVDSLGQGRLGGSLAGTPYEAAENKDWSRKLRDAAALIKAEGQGTDLGVRAIALDLGGWDHHANLRSGTGARARELSQVLDAFMVDLGEDADRTLLLAMTEFGRTAFENGSGGADHGFGTVMLALSGTGSSMRGGRILSRAVADGSDAIGWPGLGPGSLHSGQQPKYSPDIPPDVIAEYDPYERDLAVTIDFRDVLADVLQGHLGLTPSQVFGGSDSPLLGHAPGRLPDGGLFPTIAG